MRRTAAMLLAGVAQGAAVLVIVGVIAGWLGGTVSIVCGAILLLLTRPLQRALDGWLRVRLGEPVARRAALARALAGGAHELRRELRLRYAAIEVHVDGGSVRLSESGAPEGVTPVRVEHRGERVGSLLLAPATHAGELAELAAPVLHAEQTRLVAHARDVRLGHELHDRVGPSLAALKLLLHTRALSGDQLAAHADEAAQEVRRVLAELGPVGLGRDGLVATVETLAARLTAGGGPVVTVESSGAVDTLDPAVAEALYAIAVEALGNVVTHAGARMCRVRLESAERVRLVIEDDGRGVPPDAVPGLGSASMRRRAGEIGGELRVTVDGGTRVELIA